MDRTRIPGVFREKHSVPPPSPSSARTCHYAVVRRRARCIELRRVGSIDRRIFASPRRGNYSCLFARPSAKLPSPTRCLPGALNRRFFRERMLAPSRWRNARAKKLRSSKSTFRAGIESRSYFAIDAARSLHKRQCATRLTFNVGCVFAPGPVARKIQAIRTYPRA